MDHKYPPLFKFGTHRALFRGRRFTKVGPFTWGEGDELYETRTFYLTLWRRTFFLDTNFPVKPERINGVPK